MNDLSPAAAPSLLAGAQIALRYSAIPHAQWYGERGKKAPASWLALVHRELAGEPQPASWPARVLRKLAGFWRLIRREARQSEDAEAEKAPSPAVKYVKSLASFYSDVTIPFTLREQLPVSALVVTGAEEEADKKPLLVEIGIGRIETFWESRTIEVPEAVLTAELREVLTLFESGHIVYTPSFLLRPSPVLTPLHITALTSLVSTPSAGYGLSHEHLRSAISFRFIDAGSDAGASKPRDLVEFVNARIEVLARPESRDNVFADLVRPVLKRAGWSDGQRDRARETISKMKWKDIRSASIEMVGADLYDEFVSWCDAARTGRMKVGDDERAFAALGQNILDVKNQDESEIADSLSQAVKLNGELLLIHPKMTFRCSRQSRTFNEMRDVVGGCPYVMLTDVVLAYNEYLLDLSAQQIEIIQGSVRRHGWGKAKGRVDIDRMEKDLDARVELFEHQTLHVLPNIFRYPTERAVFDAIVEQRGLGQRSEWIDRFTRTLNELREDITELSERRGTRRTNRFLLALSILQGSGLFLTGLVGFGQLELPSHAQEWVWNSLSAGLAVTVAAGIIVGVWALARR